MKNGFGFSIIVPAFNEENAITDVITNADNILKLNKYTYEIIVIDDGSTDDTYQKAIKVCDKVIKNERNLGYGASLKKGILEAKYEIIIIIDADLTYPSEDIIKLIENSEDFGMVVGSRALNTKHIPYIKRFAKYILIKLVEKITKEKVPDLNSGLRMFKKSIALKYYNLLPDNFSFTTTITVAMLFNKYKVLYIPIGYRKRIGKSKIVAADFFNFLLLVIRLSIYFDPLRIFLPISFVLFLMGLFKVIIDIFIGMNKYEFNLINLILDPVISTSSLLLIISSFQVLLMGIIADVISKHTKL